MRGTIIIEKALKSLTRFAAVTKNYIFYDPVVLKKKASAGWTFM